MLKWNYYEYSWNGMYDVKIEMLPHAIFQTKPIL